MKVVYSLFERPRGGCRWTRITSLAAPRPQAVRIFQNRLIAGAMDPDKEVRLRPVSRDLTNSDNQES